VRAEPAAPPVVAVVVASRPGPWFEEALASLASQDYPRLSVLVATVGDDGATTERVASALPEAHLAQLPEGTGFAEAANAAMALVSGVAHVLICHDDVALAPDAVRELVGEAYRANAGLVCPKYVSWREPDRLLSVGMGADRLGVAYPLASPGELDQGQHDAPREVFVAPGGAVLVRVDLWEALGGYDPAIGEPGEDVELSWRAQLAGARVLVAPQAVARHLEATKNGLREGGPSGSALSARREQHRFRTLWTCYGAKALAAVLPVALLFSAAESVWAMLSLRARRELGVPLVAFFSSFGRPGELWSSRRRAQRLRRVNDLAIFHQHCRGSARVKAMVAQRLDKGHELAWAAARAPLSWRWAAGTFACVALVLAVGSRNLLFRSLPVVGQLPQPPAGPGQWWSEWWSGAPSGLLSGPTWSPPGLVMMSLAGLVSFGSAGAAVHLLALGPLLFGPLGAYVGTREVGSKWGRLAATVVYAAVPVPYNALSQGDLAGLVAYGAAPWLVAGLWRLIRHLEEGGWRAAWQRAVVLGFGLAAAASLAPALLVVMVLVGLCFSAGSALAGGPPRARALGALAASLAVSSVAFLALAPWSFAYLASWSRITSALPGIGISFASSLRLQDGPYGGGVLGWAPAVAAAIALLIGGSWRLAWAGKLWLLALASMVLAWAGSHGWLEVPGAGVLLSFGAAALSFAAALGAASVESDLARYRFGWRQFAPAIGAAAVMLAALPLLSWAGGGQWDMPSSGAEEAYAFPAASQSGDYRVLWAGPAKLLPLLPVGSVALAASGGSPGSFGVSVDGLPLAGQLWAGPRGTGQLAISRDLSWAVGGETSLLGHLLAPLSVRYIAVPTSSSTAGLVGALSRQVDLVPVGVDPSYEVFENSAWLPGFSLIGSVEATELARALNASSAWSAGHALERLRLRAARPVLVKPSGGAATFLGPLGPLGQRSVSLFASVPAGSWQVLSSARKLPFEAAGGLGSLWPVPRLARSLVVSRDGSGGQHLAGVLLLIAWAGVMAIAVARLRVRLKERVAEGGSQLGEPTDELLGAAWDEAFEEPRVG
jgi:GT2 family glycosyltransferase